MFNAYSAGIDFSRHNPTSVDVRLWRLMVADPLRRYPNESKIANEDVYDDFNLEKPFGLQGFYKKISVCKS